MDNKERAILVATAAHSDQKYGIYPYVYHLLKVAEIAEELGFEESIIVACILHDVLEDTSLSYHDIRTPFDEEVSDIVYAVTDELGKNRKERHEKTYLKIRDNWKAEAVKACDVNF
jgi:(p)ppGpp synthase/HD superfamily hydrolase